jgi:hypothetical protein
VVRTLESGYGGKLLWTFRLLFQAKFIQEMWLLHRRGMLNRLSNYLNRFQCLFLLLWRYALPMILMCVKYKRAWSSWCHMLSFNLALLSAASNIRLTWVAVPLQSASSSVSIPVSFPIFLYIPPGSKYCLPWPSAIGLLKWPWLLKMYLWFSGYVKTEWRQR